LVPAALAFLAIDVLAGVDRAADEFGAHECRSRVEEYFVLGIGERGSKIGGPAFDTVCVGDRRDFVAITPHQHGIWHQPVAVRKCDAALSADSDDRPNQMLVEAHTAGNAMHDNADAALSHPSRPPFALTSSMLFRLP
jgi:hypothetical protein